MGFVAYAPATKFAVVWLSLNGHSQINICNVLGHSISCQSLNRWLALYDETWVVQNPDEYEQRGRNMILSTENCEFMIELVRDQPGLFLSEIREQTYDSQGTLMSLQVIHNNLVNKMSITFKKADTVNIGSLFSKYAWIERMKDVPAKSLVFTGILISLHITYGLLCWSIIP